jgi:Thrombospondin type 3 repeat
MNGRRLSVLVLAVTMVLLVLLPPRPAVSADWRSRSAVGVDLGLGSVITRYNPDARDGGTVLVVSGSGRYDLAPDLALMVLLRQWFLPSSNYAIMPGVGARFEPFQGPVGRAFLDADLGLAVTQDRVTFGFDVGGGFEVDVPTAPGLGLGPFIRYGQVVNPADTGSSDGRAWAVGISGTFRFASWLAANAATRGRAPTGGGPVRPFVFKVGDSDHDGVSDDADQCPDVPSGRHPDSFRAGCPENDEDADGVPDSDDVCPATPAGDQPDRARKGCPFVDSDGDGIADLDDHCPDKAGPATNDPSTNGCPVARKAPPLIPEDTDAAGDHAFPAANPAAKKRLSRPPATPP